MTKTERKSNKLKWVLSIVSIVLSLATLIGVIVGVNNMADTTSLSQTDYHIGTINDTGKIIESKKSIYSDISTIEDLEITLAENSNITYKVVFYDEDEKFISMTETLETDFDTSSNPSNAEYFRVLITPNQVDGEDVTLNVFNMGKYTKMINVEFANQK